MKKYINGIETDMTAEEISRLPPQPTAAELLKADRSGMRCSPMQGILALGEDNWKKVLDFRDGPDSTWSQKVVINSAQTWVRDSQNISFFQYLLNFTDEQVDDLFRAAKLIEA